MSLTTGVSLRSHVPLKISFLRLPINELFALLLRLVVLFRRLFLQNTHPPFLSVKKYSEFQVALRVDFLGLKLLIGPPSIFFA